MTEYQQYDVSEDTFLRDQTAREVKTVFCTSLLTGLLVIGGLFLLTQWLSANKAFNISLLVMSVVGLTIYASRRAVSGMVLTIVGLLVFWGFIAVDSPQLLFSLVFVPSYVSVSLLASQIFRIRKVWLAVLLYIPLVVLPHLV